jgi:heme-degrading monooxygenase HmoA
MITRIVKMHFADSFIPDFKNIFKSTKPFILDFDGCTSVKLFQHESDPSIFFTISKWESTEHLENYRNSVLFQATWAKVKSAFVSKAEAWSLTTV